MLQIGPPVWDILSEQSKWTNRPSHPLCCHVFPFLGSQWGELENPWWKATESALVGVGYHGQWVGVLSDSSEAPAARNFTDSCPAVGLSLLRGKREEKKGLLKAQFLPGLELPQFFGCPHHGTCQRSQGFCETVSDCKGPQAAFQKPGPCLSEDT